MYSNDATWICEILGEVGDETVSDEKENDLSPGCLPWGQSCDHYWLNCEWLVTILTEHVHQAVQDDAGLGQLCRRHFKEDVLGGEADLGVLSVDTAVNFLDI